MAPCCSYTSVHHSRFPEKDNLRLRKPRVEKMRRDRINTCIDQLKLLLEKELHQQEPNAKLEKADVLEMTVSFLRRQLLHTSGGPREPTLLGSSQGPRECVQDLPCSVGPGRETSIHAARPPSLHVLQQHQGELLLVAQRDFTSSSSFSTCTPTSNKSLVWRPW